MDKLKVYFLLLASALIINSCAPKELHRTTYHAGELKVNNEIVSNGHIDSLINPYKVKLDATMNEVLATCDTALYKGKPSSSLGNFFADAIKEEAEKKINHPVDLAIVNYGGIRLGMIPAGEITLGKVFELMPFDNEIVVLDIDGKTLAEALDYIASQGGWPVSGVSFTIKKNSAVNIFINNKAFDITQHYSIAVSDYIANGGDNMSMLKLVPQEHLKLLMRDALIDYLKTLTAKGLILKANQLERIKHVE